MGRPKPQAIRELVIQNHLKGTSNSQIIQLLEGKVSERTVYRWISEYKTTAKLTPKKSTGRPTSAVPRTNKLKVKRLLKAFSGRKIANKLNISKSSVLNICKELNLTAFKKRRIPLLKESHISKRFRFCQFWRKNKDKEFEGWPLMFSDEKLFTVDGGLNKQNQRIYAISREQADLKGGLYGVSKFPLSVMVWVGLTENGPTKPYFVGKGETINSEYYQRRILPFAKREGMRLFRTRQWVFQQDVAKPHTSKTTQNWCENNFLKFIKGSDWPPNSPDLNRAVQSKMRQNKYLNREEFIEEIRRGVERVPLEHIKQAVNSFNKRARAVEEEKGAYCHK